MATLGLAWTACALRQKVHLTLACSNTVIFSRPVLSTRWLTFTGTNGAQLCCFRFPSSICVGIGQVSWFNTDAFKHHTESRQASSIDCVCVRACVCVQMLATVLVLWVGKAARVISFPDFDETIPRKVRPPTVCPYSPAWSRVLFCWPQFRFSLLSLYTNTWARELFACFTITDRLTWDQFLLTAV